MKSKQIEDIKRLLSSFSSAQEGDESWQMDHGRWMIDVHDHAFLNGEFWERMADIIGPWGQ